jgi:hypothetical protein
LPVNGAETTACGKPEQLRQIQLEEGYKRGGPRQSYVAGNTRAMTANATAGRRKMGVRDQTTGGTAWIALPQAKN